MIDWVDVEDFVSWPDGYLDLTELHHHPPGTL